MGDVKLSAIERLMRSRIQKYDHEKYWHYRQIVTDPQKGSRLGDLWRLYYIKRADAFNNASMGTHRNCGAHFATPPHLPHGLNGIIISHNAVIGKNCIIFHHVTIGEGYGSMAHGGAPTIGDYVLIGAGATIIGSVRIGDGARIGAGCVVTEDVPAGATVVMEKPRIIIRKDKHDGS